MNPKPMFSFWQLDFSHYNNVIQLISISFTSTIAFKSFNCRFLLHIAIFLRSQTTCTNLLTSFYFLQKCISVFRKWKSKDKRINIHIMETLFSVRHFIRTTKVHSDKVRRINNSHTRKRSLRPVGQSWSKLMGSIYLRRVWILARSDQPLWIYLSLIVEK